MPPLAVYIHIPFCTVKCGYCDFNAYAGMDTLKGQYAHALRLELAAWAPILSHCEVSSISFGGGTPGEMPARVLGELVADIRSLAPLAANAEVSLEANPGSTRPSAIAGLAEAGFNRLSFGAQSFDPAELRFLDRIHSPQAIAAAIEATRAAGIPSVGLDLIYGLPNQQETWPRSLERGLDLQTDHLSLYALTVEEGTPLDYRVRNGDVEMPDGDTIATQYEFASERLAAAGFGQYEVSNWARPGHESRHNLTYWTDGDYLGIGAGAHGYVDGERYENVAHPRGYIAAAARYPVDGFPATAIERYHPDSVDAVSDWIGLRLRALRGFTRAEFASKFGVSLDTLAGPPVAAVVEAGVLSDDGERLALTQRGRLLHGEIAVRILDHLQRHPPALANAANPR